jgi:hypothetical protein
MANKIKIPKPQKTTQKKAYRCPPKHTQFKPGQSGNPKGRPKGRKNFSTLLDKELNKKVTITRDGKKIRVTKKEVLVTQLVNEAAKGKRSYMEMLIRLMQSQEAAMQEATAGPQGIPYLSPEALGRVAERLMRKARAIGDEDAGEGAAA